MAVEAVVSYVDLTADKPLRKRLVPFQNRVPLAKPVEAFRLFRPKSGRIGGRLGAKAFVLVQALYMSICRKFRRRRKEAVLVQRGFDCNGFRHSFYILSI